MSSDPLVEHTGTICFTEGSVLATLVPSSINSDLVALTPSSHRQPLRPHHLHLLGHPCPLLLRPLLPRAHVEAGHRRLPSDQERPHRCIPDLFWSSLHMLRPIIVMSLFCPPPLRPV